MRDEKHELAHADAIMREQVVALEPVTVTKPWGREIWYSGVEARGESAARPATGEPLPLSRYLAEHGRAKPVTLLKALLPTCGDLYMEVHETKHEVYVIDSLESTRWPGEGRMWLGVDQDQRAALGDDGFRAALRSRALAAEAGAAADDVARLLARAAVRPGDVVVVPPGAPHCLPRGISVVEFQTPVFERRILAATGPVVTQDGWDVLAAVRALDLDAAPRPRRGTSRVVAETPSFSVVRVDETSDRRVPPWSVGWVAAGAVEVGDRRFLERHAFLTASAAKISGGNGALAFVAVEET